MQDAIAVTLCFLAVIVFMGAERYAKAYRSTGNSAGIVAMVLCIVLCFWLIFAACWLFKFIPV